MVPSPERRISPIRINSPVDRILLLGAVAFVFVLIGLATLQPAWFALALPFVTFLLTAVVFEAPVPQLSVHRELSALRVAEGSLVDVRLEVENQGGPLEQVWIEDILPARAVYENGDLRRLTYLNTGERAVLEYTVKVSRGVYHFSSISVQTTDYLGITRRLVRVEGAEQRLWVYPEVLELPSPRIHPRQTVSSSGLIPARQGGPGVSFFGIRQYQPGDELRWVNWRISQRHLGTVYTNEYEQERAANVGIIVDARRDSYFQIQNRTLFEPTVKAAASLAAAFLEDGNRVGLMIYGRYIEWTFPGYGKVQRERIFQALTRAEVGISEVLNTLRYLPTQVFSPKSQIVLVSPLQTEDVDFLIWLRARRYSVTLVSPDPISFERQDLGESEAVSIAARMARIERYLLIRQLQQAGVEVMDWDVSIPFDQVMRTYSNRQRRGGGRQ